MEGREALAAGKETMAEKLSDTDYLSIQHEIVVLAGLVRELPLTAFLVRINTCETIAPLVDPTLYMKAGNKLAQIKELAAALQPFQKAADKIAQQTILAAAKE